MTDLTKDELTELYGIAERVARTHRSRVLPLDIRVQAAADGVLDAYLAGETDLAAAGYRAVARAADAHIRLYGMGTSGVFTAPRAAVFWNVPAEDPIEALIERLAVRQLWARLEDKHRRTLRALVDADFSIALAAERAGTTYSTYADRLAVARRRARELWFAPETPRGHYSKAGRRGAQWNPVRALQSRLSARRARRRPAA